MSETIPRGIMATARTVADRDVNFGSYEVNVLAIARAIFAEREACAVAAAGASADFDFQKALAECRDTEHGFHSGRLHAASAIRDRSKT